MSPPESYVEEVATFRTRFLRHGVQDGARLLHLGSGGGSIDYHLKQWYDVTGMDLSPAMVAHASRLNPEVRYHVGDMRTLRLAERFDGVLVHDAISYMTTLDDLVAVYRNAAAHLPIGGVMVALPEEIPERVAQARADVETHIDAHRRVTILELDHDPDPTDHTFENLFVFLIWEDGDLRVEVDRHINGVFALDEFVGAMEAAGFDASVEEWELSDWEEDEVPLPLITAVRTS